MTVPAPSPAEFLAAPPDPDEDLEEAEQQYPEVVHPDRPVPVLTHPKPADSLASIADCLERLTGIVEARAAEEDQEQARLEAFDDLDAKHATLYELVEEIEGIVKASTSKVSLSVKAAIDRWRSPEAASAGPEQEPAPEPDEEDEAPPANDAPIEDWVAYAVRRGLEVDPGRTNRSQIRTMLGIPQPIPATEGGE